MNNTLVSLKEKKYSLFDILKVGWQIYKDNFGQILVIVLLVYIPINFVLSFIPAGFFQEQGFSGLKMYFRLIQFLEFFIGVIATIAIARLVERKIVGHEADWRSSFKDLFPVWQNVIWTNFLVGLIVLGLALLLIIPGFIWWIYYSFVTFVVVLREVSGAKALAYSKNLVVGQWWRVFGINFGLGILYLLVVILVGVVFWALPDYFLFNFISDTLIDIVAAFFTVSAVVFFLNTDYLKHNVDNTIVAIDETKQQELSERREELKQKQSRDEQRKDKEDLLAALDSQKVKYEIFWEGDKTAQDELSKFPITSYGALDLSQLQDTAEIAWKNEAELPTKLDLLVKDKNLGEPDVFVVYSHGPSLDLKTALAAVIKNAKELYGTSVDVFIACPQNKWIIEIYHEDKIYFGRI